MWPPKPGAPALLLAFHPNVPFSPVTSVLPLVLCRTASVRHCHLLSCLKSSIVCPLVVRFLSSSPSEPWGSAHWPVCPRSEPGQGDHPDSAARGPKEAQQNRGDLASPTDILEQFLLSPSQLGKTTRPLVYHPQGLELCHRPQGEACLPLVIIIITV